MLKLKPWAQNLLLIVGGVVGGIVIVEIGLRLAGISHPVFVTADERRGMAHRPGASGWQRGEGEAYVRINSDGLRDREHSKAKPENTLRIAVLGDSNTAGIQVPLEKTFVAVMERELNGCQALAGRKVEAINFGVSGYGTAQELITLRHHVWDYSPDLVVLAFTAGNDITDNSRALAYNPNVPYFIYDNGELVLDESFRDAPSFRAKKSLSGNQLFMWLIDHSRIMQVINNARKIVKKRRAAANKDLNTQGQELGLDSTVYKQPTLPAWQEAWRVTEGLIVLMRDEVREKGADFLVVTLSGGIQVHPDPSVRQEFREKLGISDLFYPERRIKTLGERESFTVLNLARPLQAYAEKEQVFLHGFENTSLGGGHPNEEGHRLAGQMIAQKLCQDYVSASDFSRDLRIEVPPQAN